MTGGERRGTGLQALWNLRALGLFLLGPVIGAMLGAEVFGMPVALVRVAGAMVLFSLGLFAILVRGERRRLARPRRPPAASRMSGCC